MARLIYLAAGLLFLKSFAIARSIHTRNDSPTSESYNPPAPAVQWGPCDPSLALDPALSCAFFEIPLDHHHASDGAGKLALIKANATADRRGTLFVNPGGPGVSGVQSLSDTSALLLNSTGGVYDIVSWDPRGVGSLTVPGDVYCFDSVDEYNAFWNGTIDLNGIEMTGNFTDQADIDRLLSQAPLMQSKYEELGQKCLNHSDGRYLQYVGTAATVRDMVALADALDGPGAPVNYWGFSYGTLLGSWFIKMFPKRVGRVILDGVVDPVALFQDEASFAWSQELLNDDDVYEGFYTACALSGPQGCEIATAGQSPLNVNANIQKVLQQAHDATVAAPINQSVPITSGFIRATMRPQLYSMTNWAAFANNVYPELASLAQMESGAKTRRSGNGVGPFGTSKRLENDTVPYSTQAILCGDSVDLKNTTMAEVFENVIATAQDFSHMFSAAWPVAPYYCSFWPIRAVERYEGPFNKTFANPILIIGNTFDPATPFASAQSLADLLGDQASLVRFNAFGHTSETGPSSCIADVVRAYTVNGTRPSNGTVCQVDADFEVFPGVSVERIMSNLSGSRTRKSR